MCRIIPGAAVLALSKETASSVERDTVDLEPSPCIHESQIVLGSFRSSRMVWHQCHLLLSLNLLCLCGLLGSRLMRPQGSRALTYESSHLTEEDFVFLTLPELLLGKTILFYV